MKKIWFKKTSLGYMPIHPMGFLISLLALVFMIPIVIATNRQAHSVSDMFYQLFVYGSCTLFWWKWVAEKTAG